MPETLAWANREPALVAASRKRYRELLLDGSYDVRWHLVKTFGGTAALVLLCLLALDHPTGWDVAVLVPGVLYGSLAEHLGHRWAMHRPVPGLGRVFLEHTVHHRHFTHRMLHCTSAADVQMVMFSPILLAYFVGCFVLPSSAVVWALLGWNSALIFAAFALVYYASFEGWHLTAHLPPEHPVARALPRLVGWFRERHRIHHHPLRQRETNFNVVLPLADHLLGVAVPPEEPT